MNREVKYTSYIFVCYFPHNHKNGFAVNYIFRGRKNQSIGDTKDIFKLKYRNATGEDFDGNIISVTKVIDSRII